MSIYLRSALLGAATGGRSTVGLTALALTSANTGSWLTSRWMARAAALATAGELVGDKLPQVPSRLGPSGLVPRLLAGAVAGGTLAHREGRRPVGPALAGVAGAIAGAVLGTRWRGWAADRTLGGRLPLGLPAAVVEDAGWLVTASYAAGVGG